MHSSRSFASSVAGGAASSANIFANASAGSASLDPERCSGRWPCTEETRERGEEGVWGRSGEGFEGRRRRMESRYDWFPRDTRRIRDERRAGAVRGGVPGGRQGAGSERETGLSGGPVSESATARGRGRGARWARATVGARESLEKIRADRGGLRAPASKSRIARRRRRCGRCTPRSTTCRRAPPRPAVLPVRAPPRRRRLRAGAGSSTPRTCCSRRRSAACSADTPTPSSVLRRRRRPPWSRRPREAYRLPSRLARNRPRRRTPPRGTPRDARRDVARRADFLLAFVRTTSRARVADRALPAAVERLARLGV